MAAKVERVACEVCLKEVPRSEALTPAAADRAAFFCGPDCFGTWMNQERKRESDDIRRAVDDGMHDLRIRKSE